jgi:RNA polymerase sigma-70 factor (ECF subfamily)
MATATMTPPTEMPQAQPRIASLDEESRTWLVRLRCSGPAQDAAVAELHALLLRAARFELNRRRGELAQLRGEERDDLAQQSADDALMAILAKLPDFRGESRFTTWAYKFALFEAGVKARRRAWQRREVPVEDKAWAALAEAGRSPHGRVEDSELISALRAEIEAALSERQRRVLVAVTLNGVPIDVLAERLGSTRGALYKTLHDARRKLRAGLEDRGFDIDGGGEEEI